MCSNYSGRCTLSNLMTLRDSNRGGCAQSCRWKYHILEDDYCINDPNVLFSMSSKDLNTIEYIKDLIDSNICSLKIEGRMKSEYYIATVVKTYRKLIDNIYANKYTTKDNKYYQKEINKAINRPTNDGFLSIIPSINHHLYDINGAGVTHEYIGYIYDYIDGYAYILSKNYFKRNDIIEIFGPNIDNKQYQVQEIYNMDNQLIDIVNQPMSKLKIKIPFIVNKHDMIRKVN